MKQKEPKLPPTPDPLYLEKVLGITHAELAKIVGCSYSSLQRLILGARTPSTQDKEAEILRLLERMTETLVTLYGGNEAMVAQWMRVPMPGRLPPIEALISVEYLVNTTSQLEAQLKHKKTTHV